MMMVTQRVRVKLPPFFPAQHDFTTHPARFKVVVCGRRSGKTTGGSVDTVRRAMGKPWPDGTCDPGRPQKVWVVAPTMELTDRAWGSVKAMVENVPGVDLWTGQTSRRALLPNGGEIWCKSAHTNKGLRGEGLDHIFIDEAAYLNPKVWESQLRPSLADKEGSATFASTPHGLNWFYRLWTKGATARSREVNPGWRSWRLSTWSNPHISRDEIEEMARDMTEAIYRQEIEARFEATEGQFFNITDRLFNAPLVSDIDRNARIVLGIDWGRKQDYTVITGINVDTNRMVYFNRFTGRSFDYMLDQALEAISVTRAELVIAEENGLGASLVEDLQTAHLGADPDRRILRASGQPVPVEAFVTTNPTKQAILDQLEVAFERGNIELQPIDVLEQELTMFEQTRLKSGRYTYGAPDEDGAHDDTVMSLAFAFEGVRSLGGGGEHKRRSNDDDWLGV